MTVADSERAPAISADDGTFQLRLPAGNHVLMARAEGYAAAAVSVWAPSRTVTLALAPTASITGKVSAGSSGEPVAGVLVRAIETSGSSALVATTVTAADGAFSLSGVAAGSYALIATSERWRGAQQNVRLAVGESAGPVLLELEPATTLNITLSVAGEPCPDGWVELSGPITLSGAIRAGAASLEGVAAGTYAARLQCSIGVARSEALQVGAGPLNVHWDLALGLELQGVVETPGGEPVAGAEVVVDALAAGDGGAAATCTSDARGEFACGGLPAGEYAYWLEGVYPTPDNVLRVTLSEAAPSFVRLRSPGFASLAVRIAGAAEIAELALVAQRPGGPPRWARRAEDRFEFDQLELGEYAVSIDGREGTAQRVRLARAGERALLELSLPERATLQGRVVDERGAPVVDAWVRARTAGSDLGLPRGTPALTDSEGRFSVQDLWEGAYDLEVNAAGSVTTLSGARAGGPAVQLRMAARSPQGTAGVSSGGE